MMKIVARRMTTSIFAIASTKSKWTTKRNLSVSTVELLTAGQPRPNPKPRGGSKPASPWYRYSSSWDSSPVSLGPFLGSFGSDEPQRIQYVPAQVVEVIDIRTIIVEIDGEPATVRYIGVEPLPLNSLWYDVGLLANQQLVANSEVVLEADETETDDFGRLMRYVYVNQNLVNGILLRNGIALPAERRDGLDRHYNNMQGWSEAAKFEGLGHWSNARPQFVTNGGDS